MNQQRYSNLQQDFIEGSGGWVLLPPSSELYKAIEHGTAGTGRVGFQALSKH